MWVKSQLKKHEPLWWRAGLVLLVVMVLLLLVALNFSGSRETQEAFYAGQRLIVRIDDGTMKGKRVTTVMPKTEAQTAGALTPVTVAPSTPLLGVNNELLESAEQGTLPVIGKDGTKPWRYYSKKYVRTGSEPMIAIIVTGLGANKQVTNRAVQLPEDIALSFSPYAPEIANWATAARATGHEVMLDLPMQPSDYPASDPGPYGLLVGRDPQTNVTNLERVMARLAGYTGFAMPYNEIFSTDTDSFSLLLQALANRGVMLVFSREPARDELKTILNETSAAHIVADMVIDEDPTPETIASRLATLEQIARRRGHAVAVAQAYPVTLNVLHEWVAGLARRGVVLAPVTMMIRFRYS